MSVVGMSPNVREQNFRELAKKCEIRKSFLPQKKPVIWYCVDNEVVHSWEEAPSPFCRID